MCDIRNCLHKLLKKTNILFGEVWDYFFITKFQFGSLAHDHGLIWVKDVFWFGISMNEEIDKYLTIDQTILPKYIHNAQIHQHKRTWKKKW